MDPAKVLEVLYTFPVEGILKSAASLAAQEISLFRRFKKELTELRQSLIAIQQFLGDVSHQSRDEGKAVENWVKKLKGVAHDADDVLGDINYEVLRRKVEIQNHMKKKVLNFFSLSNPILFRQKMAHKIKSINASLAVLKNEASFIGLVARRIDPTPPGMANRETVSSFGHDEKIIGREKIVSDIIATLIESKNQEENLSVMAIMGMGGLGKTALAKLIFNEDAIGRHFVEKMWVCVSNTFDINSILDRMLELTNPSKAGLKSREALLNNLKESLTEKKYILILDDVWNEDDKLWSDFTSCLLRLNSAPGSIAIVTTRSAKVASITGTMPRCVLGILSMEDCWSILKGEALLNGNASSLDSDQERIGRAIAGKCAGVPLVAKVLGSVMRSKNSRHEWSAILESEIWELSNVEDKITSVLKLSFDNLTSPSLKQCFAYCSMFKKDFEIEKDDLVQLWMAQGFLHSSPSMSMEDTGNEYFNILLQNSLFQDAREDKGGDTKCKMHDLVHDLAEKAFKSESLMRDLDQMDDDAFQIQHAARISSTTLKRISQGSVGRLRSLSVDCNVPGNIFQRFRALRMLNLFKAEIKELPSSIGKLKHLRYLNISGTEIEELPKSIGKLYNLQTLRMSSTYRLRTFPTEMENLINLRHVYFDEYEKVPFGMTKLTHLQTLTSFNLDIAGRHRLDELGGLNELKGKLVIGSLEFVRDKEEAKKSNLVGKANIRELILRWSNFFYQDILEGLQPPPKLESLTIQDFPGTEFASWMMIDSLPINLTEIKLKMCRKCEAVPPLGHLPNLKSVLFEGIENLKCVGDEFYGYKYVNNDEVAKKVTLFPALKSLSFIYCPALSEWKEAVVEKVRSTGEKPALVVFPCLEKLDVRNCAELRSAPTHFPSLRELDMWNVENAIPLETTITLEHLSIEECRNLEALPSLDNVTFPRLETLRVSGCPNLESFQISPSQSLQELTIVDCPKLRCTSIHSMPSLRSLFISRCTSLEKLTILSGLHSCTSLRTLRINDCSNLVAIPSGLASCSSLSSLCLSHCGELKYFPEGLQSLSHLEKLSIGAFCKKLVSFPDFQVPSKELELYGWPKLRSLPQQIQHSTALTCLSICRFDGLRALPEWLGNLTSLTELKIRECKNLRYLPTVKAMQRLTKLHKLKIESCPLLAVRCESSSGPEWQKISHIPFITVLGRPSVYSAF